MGISPDIWGPAAWQTIHLFCLAAPESLSAAEQLYYIAFFQALGHVLPCATCANHYQEHLKTFPIESSVATREALFQWSVNIHNAANQSLGKPLVSLEDARAHWNRVISGSGSAVPSRSPKGFGDTSGWVYYTMAFIVGILAIMGILGIYWKTIHVSKKK